jgi:outer membrane protein OmpA-like peptidoglycan-associated protein
MNIRMGGRPAFLGLLTISGLFACQTVSRQAPPELKDAEKSIEQAKRADVEDYMPSAMEAAERKLDKSASLLHDAADFKDDGGGDRAEAAREEAIKLAAEAKAIADGAVRILADMRSYNTRSSGYLNANDKNSRVGELEDEIEKLRTENTELEAKYTQLSSDSKTFAERPAPEPKKDIPSDFSAGKTVAYFASGSTILQAKFRRDIKELATLMKSNDDLQLTLEGFADPRGSAELNKQLAEKRLNVVAEELKANGVSEDKMKLVTVGATADPSAARGARPGELQLDRKVTATVTSAVH